MYVLLMTQRGPDVNLGHVAEAAGVSRATVSRAFSRPELLNPETVERVLSIAGRLGYVGNEAARALKTGRFRNIAVVVPDIANPFFPPLLRAVQNRADQLGYAVFLGDSDEKAERERTLLTRFTGQVEGFILAGTRLDKGVITEVSRTRPTVLVNRDVPAVSRVLIDSSRGIHEAVEHLKSHGHQRIAYLAGPRESWADQQRRSAARAACATLGLELTVVELGRPTFEAGFAAVETLSGSPATAAVAFDDVIAHGVLAGFRGRGFTVPADFSVVGCDDTLAISTDPPLTTISEAAAEAGTVAVDMLIQVSLGERSRARRMMIPTHLVVRSTTAPPRA